MELEITEKRLSETGILLTLDGRLDAVTAPDLRARLKGLVDDGYIELLVDLAGVPFIDSSGLSALVSGLKAARQAGGTLRLAGLDEQTRTAFRLTMLDRVFESYPDTATALNSLAAS